MTNPPALEEIPSERLFRKKPVVIEASQWFKNGDHPLDYADDQQGLEGGELRIFTGAERKAKEWEGGVVRYYRHPEVSGHRPCEQCGRPHHAHGWIDTLEEGHRVCPGDWIITGVKGERYPCKPDIFEVTYELAALTPLKGAAEPVAWRVSYNGDWFYSTKEVANAEKFDQVEPLYNHPAPAKKLLRAAATRATGPCYCPPDKCMAPVVMGVRGRCFRTPQGASGAPRIDLEPPPDAAPGESTKESCWVAAQTSESVQVKGADK